MTPPKGDVVLLVHPDEGLLAGMRQAFAWDPALQLETASDGSAALEAVLRHRPDLVLTAWAGVDLSGETICRAVREDAELAGTLLVLLWGPEDTAESLAPAEVGVIDEIVTLPLAPDELARRIRGFLRLRHALTAIREGEAERGRLLASLEAGFDQVVSLLTQLVDQSLSGASARGESLAALALRVADRFEIDPELHRDLALAARLHEIGRLVATEAPPDSKDGVKGHRWRRSVAAQALLQRVDTLRPVAELIGCMDENWDGTGHPDRLQVGQIPLRSRILRVLVDFQELTEEAGLPEAEALERLRAHNSTRYDPLVVAYVEAVLQSSQEGDWRATRRKVAVGALQTGMVLADDLTTSSGVKLISAGSTLNEAALDAIHRRHESDPIPHGVWVRT